MRHTGTIAKQIGPGITSVRTCHSGLKNHIARFSGYQPQLAIAWDAAQLGEIGGG